MDGLDGYNKLAEIQLTGMRSKCCLRTRCREGAKLTLEKKTGSSYVKKNKKVDVAREENWKDRRKV